VRVCVCVHGRGRQERGGAKSATAEEEHKRARGAQRAPHTRQGVQVLDSTPHHTYCSELPSSHKSTSTYIYINILHVYTHVCRYNACIYMHMCIYTCVFTCVYLYQDVHREVYLSLSMWEVKSMHGSIGMFSQCFISRGHQESMDMDMYSRLQIGWHSILGFFLFFFYSVPGVPGFSWD